MNKLNFTNSLISASCLFENINASNLVILDATIPKVGQTNSDLNLDLGIKNARFFDIKNVFSDKNSIFPNTIVDPKTFEKEVQRLGINNDSAIVVYDHHGVYSSPRAWWLFKTMGHQNVAVLNGGFPEWIKANYPTEKTTKYKGNLGVFKANYQSSTISDYHRVLEAISNKSVLILDARSSDRFKGVKSEPREGLRSGHIPNSKNLPYTELVDGAEMLIESEIFKKFDGLVGNTSEIIFSCGSGITACILALGADVAGYKNLSVYDGSWTEWGSLHELPIEV
ncbi:sulfurtransferase [Aureibaculum marinum]|uniref:Sulfurtransferase n=2 Tax=Pseudomonadati TaxID=3379134 RepID=A0A3N4P0U4_9FLAO|nr:sulfurtransferase [Aureibaculum marinum]RPD98626.1 sulfurtransferase [Aureibaculum marinum]